MPKNSKVDRCYQKVKQDHSEGSAAAICQSSTGQSLKTGKPTKSLKALRVKYKRLHKNQTSCYNHDCHCDTCAKGD